jgi:hypothetical protein
VPVDEYQKNLAAMVAAAKAAGVQQVLLITPPPVDEAAWASEVRVLTEVPTVPGCEYTETSCWQSPWL